MLSQGRMTGTLVGVVLLLAAAAAWAEPETGRAAWLLERGRLTDLALTGASMDQAEIGGGGQPGDIGTVEPGEFDHAHGSALPVLMSLVLPGSGEIVSGKPYRGIAMAALDIFAWTQVSKYHHDGKDLRDAYIAYANAHYSDQKLVLAYTSGDGGYLDGQGALYFPKEPTVNDTTELDKLSLYVSKENDFREYYENLGKWDQFIFGWDDYVRPDDAASIGVTYTPTGLRDPDLKQPWVSKHRVVYQNMRNDSNQAYKKRDRWLYVNIGLRVVSVLETAYLQGLLGGGPDEPMKVGSHTLEIHAVPYGFEAGTLAASLSF